MAVLVPPRWVPTHLVQALIRDVQNSALGIPGLRLTSFYRNQLETRRVGGARESQHLVGLAVDIAGPRESLNLLASRSGLPFEEFRGHVHIQLYPAGFLGKRGFAFESLP